MHQPAPIDISVTISQTLRDLRAAGVIGDRYRGPPLPLASAAAPAHEEAVVTRKLHWERVCLRNDGTQPMVFDGLRILNFSGDLCVGNLSGRQNVLIYLRSPHALVASLSLELLPDAPTRSVFLATTINPATPKSLFLEWCKTLSQTAASVTQSSRPADMFTEILYQFQSITSHSIQFEPVS
ncbi:hypothetical protein MWU60_00885 [Yoonia sp. F2084L]|uniref:hypothetical protein n=1 Tax=Yoonia sp. F2084L TaxID=2926419 RepID=UPI001FF3EEB1|nr:hypothetical protein [Yoonia sp. F2084L]MCK0094109.1 hypothetical protein [Yoonia sp. F2084L]